MPAYGYEFYLLVVNSISHSFAALTREISSWPLEDKIHIHARACNILYIRSMEYLFTSNVETAYLNNHRAECNDISGTLTVPPAVNLKVD